MNQLDPLGARVPRYTEHSSSSVNNAKTSVNAGSSIDSCSSTNKPRKNTT